MVAKAEHKKRTGCPVACGLDVVGDHWTLLVVRNLMFLGLHEYKDMLKTEEKISSSILSDRLKKLEAQGVIESIAHPVNGRRKLYYLTPIGKDLIHLMVELVLWADRHMCGLIRIPSERRALLENGPEKFKAVVLEQLSAWERENLS